jgi:PDDEXK-like domain of unknown function (DUF3799)
MIKQNSNREYHSGEGLGSTDLKQLLRSAAHFQARKGDPHDPTAEMLKGSLVHSLILEPEKTSQDFAIGDFNIRRGKAYDDFCEANRGREIVSQKEFDEASLIATAFERQRKENADLSRLLDGVRENSFYWTDKATGVLCKCRPDVLTAHGAIVDIKTTRDATFDAFQKQVVDLQYFVSAAHYVCGVNQVLKEGPALPGGFVPPTAFVFVVIETKEPYLVATYYLDDSALIAGWTLCKKALETYANAKTSQKWEGYPKQMIKMDLPKWFYQRMGVTV